MTNFLIELALVLALLLSLALQWRRPTIVTEYRDRDVPAPPPVRPAEPTVTIRFLGDFGHVCGEITIPVKARRPVLHHGGTAYTAERYTNGIWFYRRMYG